MMLNHRTRESGKVLLLLLALIAVGAGAAAFVPWRKKPASVPVVKQPSVTAIKPPQAQAEIRDMTIKELGYFDYDPEKGGTIPDDVRGLDGATIRLHGYMISLDTSQGDKMSRFTLIPTLGTCCYGKPPEMRHTVPVTCREGKTVAFTPEAVIIVGTLSVKEVRDGGYVISIFQMTCDKVEVEQEPM